MITTGEVTEINISDEYHTNYLYRVHIPIFDNPNSSEYKALCTACTNSGTYSPYKVGDKVYIDFVNSNMNNPVILGKIYQGLDDEYNSHQSLDSLSIQNSLKVLSNDIQLGEFSYDFMKEMFIKIKNIETLIDEKIAKLNDKEN